jgi:hypothetical protein
VKIFAKKDLQAETLPLRWSRHQKIPTKQKTMNTDTHDKTRRASLNLPPVPLNDNRKIELDLDPYDEPPLLGVIALYAFGVGTGFGLAMLAFAYAF